MYRAALAILTLIISFTTSANNCGVSKKLDEEIDQTTHIFIAKIMQTKVGEKDKDGFQLPFSSKFEVLEVFKGNKAFNFSELSFSPIGIMLIPGRRYLVFTNNGEVGGCVNSTQDSSFPQYTQEHRLLIELITDYIQTSYPIDKLKLCLANGYDQEVCNKHADSQ